MFLRCLPLLLFPLFILGGFVLLLGGLLFFTVGETEIIEESEFSDPAVVEPTNTISPNDLSATDIVRRATASSITNSATAAVPVTSTPSFTPTPISTDGDATATSTPNPQQFTATAIIGNATATAASQ